jgi:hypothetical protein
MKNVPPTGRTPPWADIPFIVPPMPCSRMPK